MNYNKIIEKVTANLLDQYTAELDKTKDEEEYIAVVMAAFVFQDLITSEFKYGLSLNPEMKDDDPAVIVEELQARAIELASVIKTRAFATEQMN